MNPVYRPISEFPRGTLYAMLHEAYALYPAYERLDAANWRIFDDFFFDRPDIADQCGFITELDGHVAGFVTWDPRNIPEYATIGHNCVLPEYRGRGIGTIQMKEALRRIAGQGTQKIAVTTNEDLLPAQKMYEKCGFILAGKRPASDRSDFRDYTFIPESPVILRPESEPASSS